MKVLSLFSGVGGMDLGFERAGHEIVGMCEIDKKARSVLARHWPSVPIHDDVTTFDTEEWRGRVDLVAGGSPCQDLSVAGRRKGLDGARSGLFWHQCRIADQVGAGWVVWENVAGALSSNNGADFAAVLWGITGALPELPDGKRWGKAGVIVGPKRTAVWRLLDAQYFGVAQRRRRVFLVAGPRDLCRPEILFECASVCWDSPPSRTSGEEVAGTLGNRIARSHTELDGHGAYVPFVKVIRSGARDADGNLPPEVWRAEGVDPTLNQFDISEVRSAVVIPQAITYPLRLRGRDGGAQLEIGEPDVANSVSTSSGGNAGGMVLAPEHVVRRLTPRECERLMGWPDDWTRFDADGNEIADSHRYRMCGNGVVSNVTEWIGRQIRTRTGQ